MKCIDCQNVEMCLDHNENQSLIGCTSGIPERKKQTNADRIRSMSDEELAEFPCKVKSDYQWLEHEFPSEEESEEWVEWLQSEVEE
ncbi:MAG: hypothetical protein ACI4DR_01640 [Roseburia sp.]